MNYNLSHRTFQYCLLLRTSRDYYKLKVARMNPISAFIFHFGKVLSDLDR